MRLIKETAEFQVVCESRGGYSVSLRRCVIRADGSFHAHSQEKNSVLHRGLHPLKHRHNVSDFHWKRGTQSPPLCGQWHEAALTATGFFQLNRNWNQSCPRRVCRCSSLQSHNTNKYFVRELLELKSDEASFH